MSYPATVVFKRDGRTEYFVSSIYEPADYLLESTEALRDTFAKSDRASRGLNSAYSDSGILVDEDSRSLLYFGGEIEWEIGLRTVLRAFISQEVKPGWTVRFCPKLLNDFADHLSQVHPYDPSLDHGPYLNDLDYWIGGKSRCDQLADSELVSLAVVKIKGCTAVHTVDSMYITDILDHGEDLLTCLAGPGVGPMTSGIDGDGAVSGFFADADERRLSYWYVNEDKPQSYYERFWRGWALDDLRDDYRAFARAAGGAVAFDEKIDRERSIRYLRSINKREDGTNAIPPDRFENMLERFLSRNAGLMGSERGLAAEI
ncbi:hypothetical protein [Hugonella massiliensis]|uniref:hypothetical protein n=1 Tax=Hugonella massiliensis TaxID=1720315 RepID=UPI00073EB2DB|nr:hypothetical protein [Hugonella massiliensis]